MTVPYESLTPRQKNILANDIQTYEDYLMNVCEEKIIARRFHQREKQLEDVYRRCEPSIPFQERETYVESRLEARIKYFRSLDDLNNKGSEIEQIMKELQKAAAKE